MLAMVLGAKSTINHFARVQDQLNFVAFWIHWVPQGPMLLIPSRWIFYYFARLLQKAHPAKKGGHNTRCQQGDTRVHGSMRPRYPSKLPTASVLRDRRKGPFDPNLLRIWERCTRHTKKDLGGCPWKGCSWVLSSGVKKNGPTRAVVGMLWGSKASWGKTLQFSHKGFQNKQKPSIQVSWYPNSHVGTWATLLQSQGAGSQNELTSWGSRKTAIHVQPGQVFGIFQKVGMHCWLASANHLTGSTYLVIYEVPCIPDGVGNRWSTLGTEVRQLQTEAIDCTWHDESSR